MDLQWYKDHVKGPLFEKMMLISKCNKCIPPQWICPSEYSSESSFSHNIEEMKQLQGIRSDMLEIMGRLSDKDLGPWRDHTTITNPAGFVVNSVKKDYRIALCTQAWCKLSEMLAQYPSLLPESGTLNSVHLCEAPGAFISALHNYINRFEIDLHWNWQATTLNPYYEGNNMWHMISSDSLIFDTFDQWLFGQSNSGDITLPSSLHQLIQQSQKLSQGGYDLITADGSFDCTDSPASQESQTFPLHLCEAIVAINCLRIGGNLLLKRFTCYEKCSVSLLFLLHCHFDEVHIIKPALSKSGNCETYTICLGFKGCEPLILHRLYLCYGKDHSVFESHFPVNYVPSEFCRDVIEVAKFFAKHQRNMIEFNLESVDKIDEDLFRHLNSVKWKTLKEWVRLVELCHMPMEISFYVEDHFLPWNQNPIQRRKCGSYLERLDVSLHPKLLLEKVQSEISKLRSGPSKSLELEFESNFLNHEQFNVDKFIVGTAITNLQSSILCDANLFKCYRNLCDSIKLDMPALLSHEFYCVRAVVRLDSTDLEWEIRSTKQQWIKFLLKLCKYDDGCVISISLPPITFLTRFSANILLILCHLGKVTVQANQSQTTILLTKQIHEVCENQIIGKGEIALQKMLKSLINHQNTVLNHEYPINTTCSTVADHDYSPTKTLVWDHEYCRGTRATNFDLEVLEFLPNYSLTDRTFYRKLSELNNNHLHMLCEEIIAKQTDIIVTNNS